MTREVGNPCQLPLAKGLVVMVVVVGTSEWCRQCCAWCRQCTLVQQAAVHHMHHAPLRGANPWFGQRQLARVPHIPSHGTMTPPNTLILRSTLRKKLIKISRASNFAAVPPSPSMNATFFCRPSLSRLLLFRPRLFGLFVTKGCTDDNLHSAALLSVCYPT